jgi:hypothetical protein
VPLKILRICWPVSVAGAGPVGLTTETNLSTANGSGISPAAMSAVLAALEDRANATSLNNGSVGVRSKVRAEPEPFAMTAEAGAAGSMTVAGRGTPALVPVASAPHGNPDPSGLSPKPVAVAWLVLPTQAS